MKPSRPPTLGGFQTQDQLKILMGLYDFLMDLQLDQLRALNAAVTEGTFEAAARSLRVTPSAITQRITALEDSARRLPLQRTQPSRAPQARPPGPRLAPPRP